MGGRSGRVRPNGLDRLNQEISNCRACPRLVAYRERIAREKVKRFTDWDYWGRAVPSFGDPAARVLLVGLAPAAHGANRTGRMFTGDRSGDWLFRALHRAGFANQPTAVSADDGLTLTDCYVTAAVHCAPPDNKPANDERDRCLTFLEREFPMLDRAQVFVALGGFALRNLMVVLKRLGDAPAKAPKFSHGGETELPSGRRILTSFHPSQQNTFTGRLTEPMFDSIFSRCRELVRDD